MDRERRGRLAGLARRRLTRNCATLPSLARVRRARCRRRGFQRRAAARHGRIEPRPGSAGARASARRRDFPKLHVLDSTDPQQVTSVRAPDRSGADAVHRFEQIRHHARAERADGLFLRTSVRRASARRDAAHHFVAITDPGSQLEKDRRSNEAFTGSSTAFPASAAAIRCCRHSASCRSRRSATTCARFSNPPASWSRSCGPEVPPAENPGVELGLAIGVAGASRAATRSPSSRRRSIAAFGAWAEQLLAESTGKHGKGVIPIAGEPLGDAVGLRRAPAVHLSARRRAARRRAGQGGRCARARRPAGGAHRRSQSTEHLAAGILPLRDRDRRRRRGHRHQSVRSARRRGEQGRDARD